MAVSYSLTILWRERIRFLPGVLAVGFSALLATLQVGVLIGTVAIPAQPIDGSSADLFVAARGVESIDQAGSLIPEDWAARLLVQPEVERVETYLYGFEVWRRPGQSGVGCGVVGSRLGPGALGAMSNLTDEQRARLEEPGTVAVDRSDLKRLGLEGDGEEVADLGRSRVRVVAVTEGIKSLGGPMIFCSEQTARLAVAQFYVRPRDTVYLLASCRDPDDAGAVAARLRRDYPGMSAWTRRDFSRQTRLFWMTETKAGIALAFTSGLGLLVGLLVTSQTLYSAMVASLREFALLRALGVRRRRIAGMILLQSLGIGVAGLVVAGPAVWGGAALISLLGGKVELPLWLLTSGAGMTIVIALASGLFSLRSLRLFEPISLLR